MTMRLHPAHLEEKRFPNFLFHALSTMRGVLEDALRTLEKDPVRVFGLAEFIERDLVSNCNHPALSLPAKKEREKLILTY